MRTSIAHRPDAGKWNHCAMMYPMSQHDKEAEHAWPDPATKVGEVVLTVHPSVDGPWGLTLTKGGVELLASDACESITDDCALLDYVTGNHSGTSPQDTAQAMAAGAYTAAQLRVSRIEYPDGSTGTWDHDDPRLAKVKDALIDRTVLEPMPARCAVTWEDADSVPPMRKIQRARIDREMFNIQKRGPDIYGKRRETADEFSARRKVHTDLMAPEMIDDDPNATRTTEQIEHDLVSSGLLVPTSWSKDLILPDANPGDDGESAVKHAVSEWSPIPVTVEGLAKHHSPDKCAWCGNPRRVGIYCGDPCRDRHAAILATL